MGSLPKPQGTSREAQYNVETAKLLSDARRALHKAVDFSLSCQQPDGHWVAPVSADATFTAQYVMFKYAHTAKAWVCLRQKAERFPAGSSRTRARTAAGRWLAACRATSRHP